MSRKEFDVPAAVKLTAAAGLRSCAELHTELGAELTLCQVQALHQAARKACNDALINEKKILTRASPLLPQAIRRGMASPDAAVHDYKEWFGGRAAKFAAPGSVASMFSPAAYLAALYREAKKLYPAGNAWHIDTRRPDLKNLVLSQVNLDT
ncbi:Tc toxin subunit A, partial [Pseudomonas juntendi]|uniref:Tc toxin subunit A n=2 Tax=Pseudomonas TaxID=286 RepID=UPI0034D4A415